METDQTLGRRGRDARERELNKMLRAPKLMFSALALAGLLDCGETLWLSQGQTKEGSTAQSEAEEEANVVGAESALVVGLEP